MPTYKVTDSSTGVDGTLLEPLTSIELERGIQLVTGSFNLQWSKYRGLLPCGRGGFTNDVGAAALTNQSRRRVDHRLGDDDYLPTNTVKSL